ncbi:hypothetical protein BGW41_006305 [Actinomortierella wolfii]|nr:hypothetical protein BGW41_006305 [Actinomortierella wolfii]
MADINGRLKFLWTASHSLLASCPAVSAHLMSQFLSLASDRDLRLHEDIQTKACAGCGSIFTPGLNTRVRVVPSHNKILEKQRRKAKKKVQSPTDGKEIPSKSNDGNMKREEGAADSQMDLDIDTNDEHSGISKKTVVAGEQSGTRQKDSVKFDTKFIRLVPWTEIHRQQAQRQQLQQQRLRGMAQQQLSDKERRIKARAKRMQKKQKMQTNHLHYTCLRCKRVTEIPGATRGQIENIVKQTTHKKANHMQAINAPAPTQTPSDSTLTKPTPPTKTATISSQPQQMVPSPPTGSGSYPGSAKSSPTSSPARTPPPSTIQSGGEKSNRKKKKNNLASLLASQKSRNNPPSSTPPSGSGDSALASFLAGL